MYTPWRAGARWTRAVWAPVKAPDTVEADGDQESACPVMTGVCSTSMEVVVGLSGGEGAVKASETVVGPVAVAVGLACIWGYLSPDGPVVNEAECEDQGPCWMVPEASRLTSLIRTLYAVAALRPSRSTRLVVPGGRRTLPGGLDHAPFASETWNCLPVAGGLPGSGVSHVTAASSPPRTWTATFVGAPGARSGSAAVVNENCRQDEAPSALTDRRRPVYEVPAVRPVMVWVVAGAATAACWLEGTDQEADDVGFQRRAYDVTAGLEPDRLGPRPTSPWSSWL